MKEFLFGLVGTVLGGLLLAYLTGEYHSSSHLAQVVAFVGGGSVTGTGAYFASKLLFRV